MQVLIVFFAFLITVPLIFIIIYIFREGITKINWTFLTKIPKPVGESGGGIVNALIGSILIVVTAAVMAIPLGIMCGIYLSENKTSRLSYWSRLSVDVLQGVPSIVTGIVVYFWVVKPIGTFSAFSGSIALAIMMLPILIRSTEETLKLIPFSLKEAGLALGLPYHKVILKVIVPCGVSGILIRHHVIHCAYCRGNSSSFIYGIWESFSEYKSWQTHAKSSFDDFQLCHQSI